MKRTSKRQPRGHVVDALVQSVCDEFAGELEQLAAEYAGAYPDPTPAERLQIDILIHSQWLWNCLNRVDDRIWNQEMEVAENPDLALAEVWIKRSADFMRVNRRTEAASREFYRALSELQRLRGAHQRTSHASGPSKSKPAAELLGLPTGRWII